MKHKIEIAPNLAICIDGERVIGSKPHGLFLTTKMIVSDEDLKRLADRCLEVISDRKTESNSEKPNNSTISKMEQVEDEPKTQTKTQNSNLTFEKRTMRDCYNCKRYETEGECVECHYEPKDECAKEYEELGLKELKELIEADRKTEQTEREDE